MAGEADLARLVVTLEASTKAYERQLARANGTTVAALKRMEKDAAAAGSRIDGALAAGLGNFKAFAAIVSGIAIGKGISVLTGEFERLAQVADDAQRIGITAELLQSLQFAAAQAGGSAEEITAALVRFNKEAGTAAQKSSELGKLFRANGVSATDAAGNLRPVNDLLEEFARLVDGAANDQEAAAIAARGFGKAGAGMVPVLREIAGGLQGVQEKATQAGVVVAEDLVRRAGEFDDAWQAAITRIKASLASLALTAAGVTLPSETAKMPTTSRISWSDGYADVPLAPDAPIVDPRITGAADIRRQLLAGKTMMDTRAAYGSLYAPRPTVIPASGGGGGGGGGASENAYERETKSIREKIAALEAEAAAVGKTALEAEKLKTAQELKTAAEEAELAMTPERLAQIDAMAAQYAEAKVRVDELKKAQQEMIATLDAVRSTAGSTLGALGNDLVEGATAAEALKTAVDSIRTALINALSNQLIAALFGAPGTAGGGLFATIFGGGRAAGGVMAPGRSYRVGERGVETVVPLGRARVIPERTGVIGGRRGPSTIINAPLTVDARGADPSVLPKIQQSLAEHEMRLTALQRAPEAQRRGGAR